MELPTSLADVAELADALDSGSSSRKGVEVQVLSSAPNISVTYKEKGRSKGRPSFLRDAQALSAAWLNSTTASPGCLALPRSVAASGTASSDRERSQIRHWPRGARPRSRARPHEDKRPEYGGSARPQACPACGCRSPA